jgi:hypothetical protein
MRGKTFMTAKCIAIIGGLSVFSTRPVPAQRIAEYALLPTTEPSRIIPTFSAAVADSQAQKHRTYWLEGALLGAAITGALGVELSGICEDCHHNKLLAFVMGAVPGFTIGAFIGDSAEKKP